MRDLFLGNNSQNEDVINAYLRNDVYSEIKKNDIRLALLQDCPIWTDTQSGDFSIRSAWQVLRLRAIVIYLYKRTWSKFVEQKISIFIWEMLQHAIPTDMAMCRRGIQLVAKCSCCAISPSFETASHLLITFEIAVQV